MQNYPACKAHRIEPVNKGLNFTSFWTGFSLINQGFIQASSNTIQGLFKDFEKTFLQFSRTKKFGKVRI